MYDFLFIMIELFLLAHTVQALQGKTCQDRLLSGGGRSVGAKILGGRGRPWGLFFGSYKTIDILLSDSVNCTVLRAVVLTQYRRVTRQTDERNCRSYYSTCNTSIAARCKNLTSTPNQSNYHPLMLQ